MTGTTRNPIGPSLGNDLLLGLRLMTAGSRDTTRRVALSAFGLAMCTLVLLAVSAIFQASAGRTARAAAATPFLSGPTFTFTVADATTYLGQTPIYGTDLAALTSTAAPPPGVTRFPAPGEMIVSPALAAILDSPSGEQLRQLLPGKVIGTIDASALIAPDDLAFYRGVNPTPNPNFVMTGSAWGSGPLWRDQLGPTARMLLLTGPTVVLVPLLIFVALCGRLGGAARDRRHAAIRLLGASAAQLRRLVAVELSVAGVAGAAVGVACFYLIRLFLPHIMYAGHTLSPAELSPSLPVIVAVVLGAPLIALLAGLLGSIRTHDTPLGVVRRSNPRPRIVWRLLYLGTVLALVLIPYSAYMNPIVGVSLVLVAVMVAVPVALPLILDLLSRKLTRGSTALRLGLGRIRRDVLGSARSVGGVAVILAGAIALTTVLSDRYYSDGEPHPAEAGMNTNDPAVLEQAVTALAGIDGVADIKGWAGPWAAIDRSPASAMRIGTCSVLYNDPELKLPGPFPCRDGDTFLIRGAVAEHLNPGHRIDYTAPEGSWSVTIPMNAIELPVSHPPKNDLVLFTPAAALQIQGTFPWRIQLMAYIPPDSADAARLAISRLDGTIVQTFEPDKQALNWTQGTPLLARTGLVVAAALTLLVCLLSQLAMTVEHLAERRRAYALTVACGVPVPVLVRAAIIGAAIPGIAAAGCGVVGGFAITWGLMPHSPTSATWLVTGVGAISLLGLVVATASLGIPLVRRTARIEGLRTA